MIGGCYYRGWAVQYAPSSVLCELWKMDFPYLTIDKRFPDRARRFRTLEEAKRLIDAHLDGGENMFISRRI